MMVEGAVPAADIRHQRASTELRHDAVERRQPCIDEVGVVTRAKKPLGAVEESMVVLVPAHATPGLEGLGDFRLVPEHRGDDVEGARDEDPPH